MQTNKNDRQLEMADESMEAILSNVNYVYIDGSFNEATKTYGAGGIMRCTDPDTGERCEWTFQTDGNDPSIASMRNVAGELLGAQCAIHIADTLKLDNLFILHDYSGIRHFADKNWNSDNPYIQEYTKFVNEMREKMAIYFVQVHGHVGIDGNEYADHLAKLAVGIDKMTDEDILPKDGRRVHYPWYNPKMELQSPYVKLPL